MSAFHKYVVEQGLRRVAPIIRNRVVLEMGCGDGFVTALLAREARRVMAFDMNERAVAFAKLIVQEPDVEFQVANAGDIGTIAEQMDQQVDVIASFEVIEHLERAERDRFLMASREILAPQGGTLVLTTPNGAKRRSRNPHHTQEFSVPQLSRILQASGFGELAISGLYLQPPWPRIEHFANAIPARGAFRWLARSGARWPAACRTLVASARALQR